MNVSSCWIKKTNCEIAPAKTIWWDHSTRCPNHIAETSTKFDCGKPVCKLSPITVKIHTSSYTYTYNDENDYFTLKYKNVRGETCIFSKPKGIKMYKDLKSLYTFGESGYWHDGNGKYYLINLECDGLSWFPGDYWTEVEYEAFDGVEDGHGVTFKDISFIMYGVHYHVYNSRSDPKEAIFMSGNKNPIYMWTIYMLLTLSDFYIYPVKKHTFPVEADKL